MKSAGSVVYTVEEQVITRLARIFKGETVAIGTTICADLAARLAKLLYAPELVLVSGSLAMFDGPPTPRLLNEDLSTAKTFGGAADWVHHLQLVCHDKATICVGPVQVDRSGSANISVVGPWATPSVQFIGSRGMPDDLVGLGGIYFHVREHSLKSLPAEVDFVCSLGYGARRTSLGLLTGVPKLLVSNLGVFDFDLEQGAMRVESLHATVQFEDVQAATGFQLLRPARIPVTEPPTSEELRAIREILDPLGLRQYASTSALTAAISHLTRKEQNLLALDETTVRRLGSAIQHGTSSQENENTPSREAK